MSIMFLVVLLMIFTTRTDFSVVGEYIYSGVTNYMDGEKETGDGWADEALLDVAFYLRMHKFNDFDRR